MISRILLVAWYVGSIYTFPQNIQTSQIVDFSSPEEVNDIPTSIKVQRSINNNVEVQNIENTVKEVEDLIKSNPQLPRLTRGEILDILENITKYGDNLGDSFSKQTYRDPKSLMLVKAYTPMETGQIMEEFYTRNPITTIVDDKNEELQVRKIPTTSTPSTSLTDTSTIPPTTSTARIYFHRKSTTNSSENKQRKDIQKKRPFRGNVQFKTTTPSEISTTEQLSTTKISSTPQLRRKHTPNLSTTEAVTVTTYHPRKRVKPVKEIKYPNHKYPIDYTNPSPVYVPGTGLKFASQAQIPPSQINAELEDLLPQENEQQEIFLSASDLNKAESTKLSSLSEPSIEIEVPDHLKKVVADLNLGAIQGDSESVFPAPHFQDTNETEKIQNILASIGLYGPTTSTTTAMPDAEIVAGSLSQDMQDLLKNFGLLSDGKKENKEEIEMLSFNPESAETNPESYVSFKPLPEDSKSRKDMEKLLEQFGLLNSNVKERKLTKTGKKLTLIDSKEPLKMNEISLDVIPDNLKSLFGEIGFVSTTPRTGRKIREQPINKNIIKEDLQHINPAGYGLKTNSNTPAENIVPLNEQDSLNPINFDVDGLRKNEVKRQDSSTTVKSEVTASTEATTTKDSPSIKDLEDSFGGKSDAVTESTERETTPEPAKTGFYYLLDWNSFFEIDDQKGKHVNLRFQPKVGDPKRFFSVTVP